MSKGIYVLGAGKLGQFVAHALASIGDAPPIVLLSYRGNLVQEWGPGNQVLNFQIANMGPSLVELRTL